jgi:hypothetical protein
MRTILLGEAPKHPAGYAFDYASPTTEQIAAVLDVDPFHLNKIFYVMNVFDEHMRPTGRGFDGFPIEEAADEISGKWFTSQRIICVGKRVAKAMELALNLEPGAIPENCFERFDGTERGSGWELARIPHPSGLRGREDRNGLVLPVATRRFLLSAAGR